MATGGEGDFFEPGSSGSVNAVSGRIIAGEAGERWGQVQAWVEQERLEGRHCHSATAAAAATARVVALADLGLATWQLGVVGGLAFTASIGLFGLGHAALPRPASPASHPHCSRRSPAPSHPRPIARHTQSGPTQRNSPRGLAQLAQSSNNHHHATSAADAWQTTRGSVSNAAKPMCHDVDAFWLARPNEQTASTIPLWNGKESKAEKRESMKRERCDGQPKETYQGRI